MNIIIHYANTNTGDIMQSLKKNSVFFAIGGGGYGAIEILWRGYTHWAMLIAGGICFVIFSYIAGRYKTRPLIFKAVLCALSVTIIEMIFGLIFNVILKYNVWDYSEIPFNFFGQICLLYSILWGVLGLIFIPFADYLNQKLAVKSKIIPEKMKNKIN